MKDVSVYQKALPVAQFENLRRAILSHHLISNTTLNRRFKQTRGFSMAFREDGVEKALALFPFLKPFFSRVGIGDQTQPLENIHGFSGPLMQAYYVNLLLVSKGGEVGRHVDATLMDPMGLSKVTPSRVSVLFLQRPNWMIGGRLKVYRKRTAIASISPAENQLVVFKGDLPHAVSPCYTFSMKSRASLVCESYIAPVESVMRIQPFSVLANSQFDVHLHMAEAALK